MIEDTNNILSVKIMDGSGAVLKELKETGGDLSSLLTSIASLRSLTNEFLTGLLPSNEESPLNEQDANCNEEEEIEDEENDADISSSASQNSNTSKSKCNENDKDDPSKRQKCL